MKARQLLDILFQQVLPSLNPILGPITYREVGKLDLTNRARFIDEDALFQNIAGVYVLADANDMMLYVGESAECINGRIWARIREHLTDADQQVRWPREMSHAYGVEIKPFQMSLICEKVLQLIHWKENGMPPVWSMEFKRYHGG